jgi:hypothetical protein
MKTDKEKLGEIKLALDNWLDDEIYTEEATGKLIETIGDVFYPPLMCTVAKKFKGDKR